MDSPVFHTPLYETHRTLGAKMVPFAGWALPLKYSGILYETKKARSDCVIFDASHMGQIRIQGEGVFSFLEYVATNAASALREGAVQYSLFLNEDAGIIDDFTLYRGAGSFLCVVNASNRQRVLDWLLAHAPANVHVRDESERTALLSVQGPKSPVLLEKVANAVFSDMEYMSFREGAISGRQCIISRTGYTGEDGFEIYADNSHVTTIFQILIREGEPIGAIPAGLGARDVLRIEAGYPLHGNDISVNTNPIEASLRWVVKEKEKDFIGKKAICRILSEGIRRKRIGFRMQERGVARAGYAVFAEGTQTHIGEVTSGTYSPNLDSFIGMAYVDQMYAKQGVSIAIQIRNKFYRALVEKFPFIPYRTHSHSNTHTG